MSADGSESHGAEATDPEAHRPETTERWAHRADPDLDAEPREAPVRRTPPPSARPPGISRYSWLIAVVVLLTLASVSINTLKGGGHLGQGVPPGQPMPAFAVPLASSDLVGDANVAQRAGSGAGRSGRTPACAVSDPRALTLCRAAGSSAFVLAFFSERDPVSIRQLDVLQAVAAGHPEVRFAAVALRGDRGRVRALIRTRHWSFPVGYDQRADVATVYGVPTLPTLTLAYPKRIVARSIFRFTDRPTLEALVRALPSGPPRPSGAR